MRQLGKWLLPILVLLNVVLVRAGVFGARDAIIATIALEGLLWLVGARQLFVAWRRYRHERSAEQKVSAALTSALGTILPDGVAHLFALEARLWITVVRWVTRRGPDGPAVFHYHRRSLFGLLALFCLLTTPLELFLWELLIPWAWLRVALFVLGIYGLVWIVGLYASFRITPHQLDERGLWLHYGLLGGVWLPYDAIAGITAERRGAPKHNDGVQIVQEASSRQGAMAHSVAFIGIGGRTDVTVTLNRPVTIERLFGPSPPVTTIHLAADEPMDFVAAVERARVGTPAPQEHLAAALQPG